jgi:tetratricopeptide (TPR) repeat protein
MKGWHSMAEQLRVFVSHSHQDNEFCHQIVQALRDAGADVWYDEHNLGWGELHEVIQRELGRRAIFVLILSKAVFASRWVKRETMWAYKLYNRDRLRAILPVTAGQIDPADFDPEEGWLFLDDFKRIEAPGYKPYPVEEAANRLIRSLSLTPRGEAPTPVAPQPTEDVDDLLTRARALMAQEKYVGAQVLLKRATHLAPRSFDAWGNLGHVFDELGRWQEALAADEHAIAIDDQQARVWYNKGTTLNNLQRYDEALAAFDRALALDPHRAETWFNKGNVLYSLKRYDEALAACDRALALDPKDAGTWTNKGRALIALKRYDEALAACDRALALDPNLAQAWYNKGSVFDALKRNAEARAYYERGLTFNPTNADDWQDKASVLRVLGRTAEADAAEQRARELGWNEKHS